MHPSLILQIDSGKKAKSMATLYRIYTWPLLVEEAYRVVLMHLEADKVIHGGWRGAKKRSVGSSVANADWRPGA